MSRDLEAIRLLNETMGGIHGRTTDSRNQSMQMMQLDSQIKQQDFERSMDSKRLEMESAEMSLKAAMHKNGQAMDLLDFGLKKADSRRADQHLGLAQDDSRRQDYEMAHGMALNEEDSRLKAGQNALALGTTVQEGAAQAVLTYDGIYAQASALETSFQTTMLSGFGQMAVDKETNMPTGSIERLTGLPASVLKYRNDILKESKMTDNEYGQRFLKDVMDRAEVLESDEILPEQAYRMAIEEVVIIDLMEAAAASKDKKPWNVAAREYMALRGAAAPSADRMKEAYGKFKLYVGATSGGKISFADPGNANRALREALRQHATPSGYPEIERAVRNAHGTISSGNFQAQIGNLTAFATLENAQKYQSARAERIRSGIALSKSKRYLEQASADVDELRDIWGGDQLRHDNSSVMRRTQQILRGWASGSGVQEENELTEDQQAYSADSGLIRLQR